MKKIIVLGMIAIFLSCILISCPGEQEDPVLKGGIRIEVPEGVDYANIPLDTVLTAVYDGSESVNYQWYRNGAAVTSASSNNKFIAEAPGTYTVTVSAAGYKKSKTSSPVTVAAKNMTFADDPDNIGRSFTIYNDLEFRVELFEAYFIGLYEEADDNEDITYEEFLEGMAQLGLVPGLEVTGIVIGTNNTWTDDVITGKVNLLDMESNNDTLKTILAAVGGGEIDIAMTYTKEEGEISKVTVEFLEGNDFTDAANMLMGGDYILKE